MHLAAENGTVEMMVNPVFGGGSFEAAEATAATRPNADTADASGDALHGVFFEATAATPPNAYAGDGSSDALYGVFFDRPTPSRTAVPSSAAKGADAAVSTCDSTAGGYEQTWKPGPAGTHAPAYAVPMDDDAGCDNYAEIAGPGGGAGSRVRGQPRGIGSSIAPAVTATAQPDYAEPLADDASTAGAIYHQAIQPGQPPQADYAEITGPGGAAPGDHTDYAEPLADDFGTAGASYHQAVGQPPQADYAAPAKPAAAPGDHTYVNDKPRSRNSNSRRRHSATAEPFYAEPLAHDTAGAISGPPAHTPAPAGGRHRGVSVARGFAVHQVGRDDAEAILRRATSDVSTIRYLVRAKGKREHALSVHLPWKTPELFHHDIIAGPDQAGRYTCRSETADGLEAAAAAATAAFVAIYNAHAALLISARGM